VTAEPLFLHRHPVDCLADDLLDLLARKEAELRPSVADEVSLARLDGAKTVIDAVCDILDRHLFKQAPS
jgi:hypothetical protein